MNIRHAISKIRSSQTSLDSVLGIMGQGVAAIAGFAFYAVVSNSVSLKEFGFFSLALATAAIIKDILDPALNASLVKFIAQGKSSAVTITRYVIQIRLLYFGLILGVGFLFASPLSTFVFNETLATIMMMTVVSSAVMSTGATISGFLQAHKRFGQDAIFVGLQPIFRLVFVLGAIFFGFHGVVEFLVVNALAYLVVIGMFSSVITYEYISGEIDNDLKIDANKFIGPLSLSVIVGVITDRIGLYITNYLLGPAQVGILSIVIQLFVPAKQIAGVLHSVFGTRFARFTTKNEANEYLKKSLGVVSVVIAGALCAAVFAKPILSIFGPEYIQGVTLLRVITIGFVFFLVQVPFVAKLIYYKARTDILVIISFLQLILTTLLNWILISKLGLLGAGVSTTIVFTLVALITMYLSVTVEAKESK